MIHEDFTIKNKGKRTSLINFERDLIKMGLLNLGNKTKKSFKEKTLKEFIYNYLVIYNRRWTKKSLTTNYVSNGNTQEECGKRRSGGDIFRICKTYFPNCTLIQVMSTLETLTTEEYPMHENIGASVCGVINKRVYRNDFWSAKGFNYAHKSKDEFNRNPGDYINLA